MGGQPSKERARRQNHARGESDFPGIFDGQLNKETVSRDNFSSSAGFEEYLLALYDFAAADKESQSQISIEKDDQLRFFGYSVDGDWADVECLRTGERGWVPANFISTVTRSSNNTIIPAGTAVPTFQNANNSRGTSGHGSQASLAGVGLEVEKWYHGAIQRSYAEYLLNSGITGSFLVRESESEPGQLTISLRYEGRIYHYRVNRDENGLYYVTEATKFFSVSDLVHHHEKHLDGLACTLLYPAAKRDKINSELNVEVDLWEIDRTEIIMKHRLGSGQYGVVYEALWKPYNILVAVKTLKENVTVRDEFLEEARLMKSLRHPNLVKLLGACTLEPPYYIVTEFMCNGNLLDYLRTRPRDELTPPALLHMGTQVARGMAYLEQHNFIHRDLAARNCLVGNQHTIKVADFGLARCMERDSTYQAHEGAKFPIKWTAPEGLVYNIFSTKSDVWAFGVLLWEIATYGKTPYPGIELQDVYVLLESGRRMDRPEGCPDAIYKLMLQCWQWHPEQRPAFSVLRSKLEAMHNSSSIEEQVAMELKRAVAQPGLRGLTSSVADSGLADTSRSTALCPPLPSHPPPSRRCCSCDRVHGDSQRSTEELHGSPGSDEGQLDSGVGDSIHSVPRKQIQRSHTHRDCMSNVEKNKVIVCDILDDRFGPGVRTSNSLGRKRTAPLPPRRTTPLKPTAVDDLDARSPFPNPTVSDSSFVANSTIDVFPLPPSPSSFPDNQFRPHPLPRTTQRYPTTPSLPSPPTSGIPSVMSASAVFPSASTDHSAARDQKSHRPHCLSCLTSTAKTYIPNRTEPLLPKKQDSKVHNIDSDSSYNKSSRSGQSECDLALPVHPGSALSTKLDPVPVSSSNFCAIQCKRSNSSGGPGRRRTVGFTPTEFHTELKQRLQQQNKSQTSNNEDQTIKTESNSRNLRNISNISKSKAASPEVPNSSGFFTIPRLKSSIPSRLFTGPSDHLSESVETSNLSVANVSPSPSDHFPTSSIDTSSVMLTSNAVPVKSSPHGTKVFPSNVRNHRQSGIADMSHKRLSWTGTSNPRFPDLSHPTQRTQRFCLPTIPSASSTTLDNVDCVPPPSHNNLLTQLSTISSRLTCFNSVARNPNASSSEVEQLIELADQMDMCRIQCSAFIDQANCSARVKFGFRDRFAPLQNLSNQLRSKKSGDRSKLITSTIDALSDLYAALTKIPALPEEENLTDCDKNIDCSAKQTTVPEAVISVRSGRSNVDTVPENYETIASS